MPMPNTYQRAEQDFERFLQDLIAASDLVSRNQAYTVAQGVFQTFRRRLNLRDAIRFANVLPPLLRALFVADWDPDEPQHPFENVEVMTAEAKALRAEHNFSSDAAIHEVAIALRKNVDERELDRLLRALPAGAREFWQA
jgi:uncharacterized protein (DUF2267 family)